jgi:tRNA(Met) cytidine acetyltransferase
LSQWPQYLDPEYRKLCVYPFQPEQIKGRFIRRFVKLLKEDETVIKVQQHDDVVAGLAVLDYEHVEVMEEQALVDKQEQAVQEIVRVASGHRRRPLVLTADRGRGKSAALGMAAAQLLLAGKKNIIVTAPRVDAVAAVFHHAGQLLSTRRKKNILQTENGSLRFIPPDELLREKPVADLLLVDEAAGIPGPLLSALLKHYARIVFASTTHGYEGSGRGFALRFKTTLDQLTPQWRQATLENPIRWAANDPLENFIFQALLLKTGMADAGLLESLQAEECIVRNLHRDELLACSELLEQTFGLLLAAHYRTSPSDLRNLLDGPNLSLYLLQYREQVLGACLLAQEGAISKELIEPILAGKRRLQGHLLPQSLMVHSGLPNAGGYKGGRIMRIAIHPAVQRKGLGRKLLQGVVKDCRQRALDYVGSSFGASESLLSFWDSNGFVAVRLGLSREASSGMHSAIVLAALTAEGAALVDSAQAILREQLPIMLSDQYRDLEPELVAELFPKTAPAPAVVLNEHDYAMLKSFARGERIYDVCSLALWKMACHLLCDKAFIKRLSAMSVDALVMRVLQHQSWEYVAQKTASTGKKEVTMLLRQVVLAWLYR